MCSESHVGKSTVAEFFLRKWVPPMRYEFRKSQVASARPQEAVASLDRGSARSDARRSKLRVVPTAEKPILAGAEVTATLPAGNPVKAAVLGESTCARRDQPTAVLFERLAAADNETDQRRLRGEIIEMNMEIARDVAWRCRGLGEVLEDLQQVAQSALAQAVDIYDSSRDAPFHVFATRTILSDLKQHVRDRA